MQSPISTTTEFLKLVPRWHICISVIREYTDEAMMLQWNK
jgi:hypothetical protein